MTTARAAGVPPGASRLNRYRWIAFAAWAGLLVGTTAAFAAEGAALQASVLQPEAAKAAACPAPALHSAQLGLDCCKGHQGVCGCRAGKIVCCDKTSSTQPGCTCHAEDGFPQ